MRQLEGKGWAKVASLYESVGECTRQAMDSCDTDEMIDRMNKLTEARRAHRKAIADWKACPC